VPDESTKNIPRAIAARLNRSTIGNAKIRARVKRLNVNAVLNSPLRQRSLPIFDQLR
jgi:hypothetical protein